MHGRRWTRRAILSGLAGVTLPALGEPGTHFPAEASQYLDPATEFPVLRLTSPSSSSFFPPYLGRPHAPRRGFLLYCSDRTGKPQAYRMDPKTGESEQLTEAQALNGSSLCLLSDERSICYFDGPILQRTLLPSLRTRVIYRLPEGWQWGHGLSIAADGRHATFVEARGGVSRLRLLAINQQSASTVIEAEAAISDPLPRPRRAAILFRQDRDFLRLVNYDGRGSRRLKVAPGGIGSAHWSSDGRSIYYLSFPPDHRALNAIREYAPDSDTDQIVSPTSQFASFSPNEDASVFVGASWNKASPHVLLLLRHSRRELTLCEHRASDAASVAPFFSADSQQVYFQSDRHGKPALYSLRVDRLLEKTET
jgi:oligogalacturonide lyase